MRKTVIMLLMALCLPCCACAASQPKPVQVDLFWEALSPDAWRNFFMTDAVQMRLPAGTLEVKHHVLVLKDQAGKWSSRKGESELLEAARLAVIAEKYPEKMRLYLVARSLDTSFHGWQSAARFAGIAPEKLEQQARDSKTSLFEKNLKFSEASKVVLPSVLLNGVAYEGKPEPLGLLEKLNELWPADKRVSVPAARKSSMPKMWVVVAEGGFGAEPARITKAIGRLFDEQDAAAEKVVYGSADFKKKFGKVKISSLPVYLFKDEPETSETLRAGTGMTLPVSEGYIVFADTSEGAYYPDKKANPKKLELFVMSQCPFGVMAEQALIDAMDAKQLPSGVQVKLHFIVEVENRDGKLSFGSLHGDPEWEENVRQIMIQTRHPDKLWAYLKARNANYRSPEWEEAAKKAGLDVAWLKKDFEEGKKLLAADAAVAKEYKISASPTFVWEGRSVAPGIGALSRIKGFENIKTGGRPAGSCN